MIGVSLGYPRWRRPTRVKLGPKCLLCDVLTEPTILFRSTRCSIRGWRCPECGFRLIHPREIHKALQLQKVYETELHEVRHCTLHFSDWCACVRLCSEMRICTHCNTVLSDDYVMKITFEDGSQGTIPLTLCPTCFQNRMRELAVRRNNMINTNS